MVILGMISPSSIVRSRYEIHFPCFHLSAVNPKWDTDEHG